MIHGRIDPVVDPQLPREQAGFRRGRSTVDQVTLLTQDIEDSFQNNEKAGVVFLDLTAAYDTVWHRGLHLKLLRIIPDRHMVGFIMEMLSNRSFVVHTNDGQRSRLRIMKNGVPQGSVLSPMLFNIYISDLPETTSRKYGYADDLVWSVVAQLVECRTRNRESPGSNPRCYRFEVWAFSFTSRRLSRLSSINEYLAMDSGGNVSE